MVDFPQRRTRDVQDMRIEQNLVEGERAGMSTRLSFFDFALPRENGRQFVFENHPMPPVFLFHCHLPNLAFVNRIPENMETGKDSVACGLFRRGPKTIWQLRGRKGTVYARCVVLLTV